LKQPSILQNKKSDACHLSQVTEYKQVATQLHKQVSHQ